LLSQMNFVIIPKFGSHMYDRHNIHDYKSRFKGVTIDGVWICEWIYLPFV
jgi:hypothetical protein